MKSVIVLPAGGLITPTIPAGQCGRGTVWGQKNHIGSVLLISSVKIVLLVPLATLKLKPAKNEEVFAGVQGAANVLSAREWLRAPKWNSTKVPAAAVIELGVKFKFVGPPIAAVTVWVLLEPVVEELEDDAAAAAAAGVGVGEEAGAGPYCARVKGTRRPIKARVFEENISRDV